MGILTEESVYEVVKAAKPTFRNIEDKIVYVVHAAFMASGFRLHAIGPPAFHSPFRPPGCYPPLEEVGVQNWNKYENFYAFIYSNPEQGGKKIEVNAMVAGDSLCINAFRIGDSEGVHLRIRIDDYKEFYYPYHFKNFGKLVEYVEKELVNKYDGGPWDTKHHHPRCAGGNDGDIHPDLKRPWCDTGGDVRPDLKRFRLDF